MDTTVTNVKDAVQKYRDGLITLGELLAILFRSLDLTEEEPVPAPAPTPPPPAPSPAPATSAKKVEKEDKS
jgi:hypothetical protein